MKILQVISFSFFALTTHGQAVISAVVGGSYILINQQDFGFQREATAAQVGLFSESKLSQGLLFFLSGFSYQYKLIDKYNNRPFSYDVQERIEVNTSLKQHVIEVPMIVKYRFEKSKFSFGAGVFISYLLNQTMNQNIVQKLNFDSSTNARITYNYAISANNEIHLTNRFNLAPVANLGVRISHKMELNLFVSYTLINPSQMYLNYNKFNLLTNSLCLTFNLN